MKIKDEDAELIKKAMEIKIDIEKHKCNCEVCQKTIRLCPATKSSIMLEILEARGISGNKK